MDVSLPANVSKSRKSIWGRIFGTSKKSSKKDKKGDDDDSFRRECALYHSFHSTKVPCDEHGQQEAEVNFTTMESSAMAEIHRDAGIIFLNKNPVVGCLVPREEDRHVQFAPTPLNKYYTPDAKSAAKAGDDNKENLRFPKVVKPRRPILRKIEEKAAQRGDPHTASGSKHQVKVSVSYVDGPQVFKTPSIPRTSTKIALCDRKNGSMPQLDVSGIARYGSLPRTEAKQTVVVGNPALVPAVAQHVCKRLDTFQGRRRDPTVSQSIPDLQRQTDHIHFFRNTNCNSNQNWPDRLSLGNAAHQPHVTQADKIPKPPHVAKEMAPKPKQCPVVHPSRSVKQNEFLVPQIPNKAINEIGLPTRTEQVCRQQFRPPFRSRSQSPHYIPLSQTHSSNIPPNQNFFSINSNCSIPTQLPVEFEGPRQAVSEGLSRFQGKLQGQNAVLRPIENTEMTPERYAQFMNQARRHVVRQSMYVQKRRYINKMCKYKSKEYEDGFSSMADDECSFNCSCSSCAQKLSKEYRRNLSRNPLCSNDDDKFFFITTKEEVETTNLTAVPEESPPKPAPDVPPRKGSYQQSQAPFEPPAVAAIESIPFDALTLQNGEDKDKIIESIYENITQILNSASKQKFRSEDVKRMISTPLSGAKCRHLENVLSGKKVSRTLFTPDQNPSSSESGGGKGQTMSPAKSPVVFCDSVLLLQEIFQKLSQECKDLLRPDVTSPVDESRAHPVKSSSSSSRYMNDIVKNLRSKELSEGDFATIIGGIAQSIFLEAKMKSRSFTLSESKSLPDLTKDQELSPRTRMTAMYSSARDVSIKGCHPTRLENVFDTNAASDSGFKTDGDRSLESSDVTRSCQGPGADIGQLPDGWSRTPTTEDNSTSNTDSTVTERSSSDDKDTSKSSESEMHMLENVIRLGMGLAPVDKADKMKFYASSPVKAVKYKSRDVLSGKGKLKLKIYHNSGLVTVHVVRAAKLHRTAGRDLNPYIKISMVPDVAKRVHWRTTVQKGQKNPVYNQKFSFEILAEDATKRLVFSVWHRDLAKERSELIGCMSFSISRVLDNSHKIDGWYRLLREGFGTQKHFAAFQRKMPCSSTHCK